MGDGEDATSSKHRSSRDDREHKSKKRRKDDGEGKSKKKRKDRKTDTLHIVDDDPDDEDMWEEKNIDMDGEQDVAANIPTAESLKLKSRSEALPGDPPLPPATKTETSLKRDEWMLDPVIAPTVPDVSSRLAPGTPGEDEEMEVETTNTSDASKPIHTTTDFFSSLGTEHRKKPPIEKTIQEPIVSAKELNPDINPGAAPFTPQTTSESSKPTPGGPGSAWRMMKLRRVYESMQEDGVSLEEAAIDRFGSMEAFEEAKEERRILDEREATNQDRGRDHNQRRRDRDGGVGTGGVKGYMFNDLPLSGGSSRSSSFRRPDVGDSIPGTPTPSGRYNAPARGSTLNPAAAGSSSASAQPANNPSATTATMTGRGIGAPNLTHTPIPSVMTPSQSRPSRRRALSPASLNKLQAKVLRAKLTNAANAADLEKEYERELERAQNGGEDEDEGAEGEAKTRVEVLPTLDGRGRLYDVGTGKNDGPLPPGNRRPKPKVETREKGTGELVRVNPDDDDMTLGEMLRQERFQAGPSDQKNLDLEYAKAVMADGAFKNDVDYMDENVDKLARKKMRSDAMKRQFAINDYKRTQQALASCPFCYGEDDSPPKAPVVAMGTRAYLSCTLHEELVEGHCLIVPIQHHLTMLEADDDVWDEVRNFMKCLMRMFAEQDKGVIFYETVISLKWQKHTVIECVPLPWGQFEELPGYFKESILMSESEWSQHKKLIDFSKRPFRRAMVPNLPYFMVQFDYKGEKGFGHVIEGGDKMVDEDDERVDDTMGGSGGDFPKYFVAEIIGNLLDLEPRKWRRPRRIDFHHNKDRVAKFKKGYDKFDWTPMIQQQIAASE
ncbi:hypothetical protein K474DRAFT_1664650 [Panus rudis PR-1116 ss-1]|nr:hypothetical protein K474DRAFT_1664650 [Panus rudis PR-1116 ss-1]